ncbi:glucose-6-phosphatase catalytic subunit 1-like [Panulirus ornatus]|uniref:glucose-6-phosphatase catalytic subunit 1-like n=1 Tax=Panulirus ornatus TaxID=150431 RepID=UPI003A8BCFA0
MNNFVESYHYWGTEFIVQLQTLLPDRGLFFMQVSDVGDPGLAFTFYFPLVVALHAGVGIKLMWSIIFCEWSNMILKWLMAGDRPYWWVHETKLYLDRELPELQQYPRTCETGPGMPSGHAKLNAAMFYVLVSTFNNMVLKKTSLLSEGQRVWSCRVMWMAYATWMTLVILARVYISAHFPHQCIAGALLGLMIAMVVSRRPILHVLTRRQYLALTATILTTVLGTYFSFKAMGGNVLWSLEKAFKWCIRRNYIHIDSTPFYSFSRYCGVSLGLGLGLSSAMFRKTDRTRFTYKMVVSLVILSLFTSQVGVWVHKSLSPQMAAWYVAEFTLNASVTYILVAILPNFVRVASRVPPGDKYKRK